MLKGFRLVDHNRESGYTVFSFQDTPELQKTISRYYLSQILVQDQVNNDEFNNTKGAK